MFFNPFYFLTKHFVESDFPAQTQRSVPENLRRMKVFRVDVQTTHSEFVRIGEIFYAF